MDTEPDSPEGDELDVLVDLVELYESKHVAMGYPSPIAAIEFRMEQAGLRPADLVSFIGSRAKVSEVLSGKRAITMPMARALHEHLGIPAAVLLQEPKTYLDGVALRLGDGRPVIGLTLRYDRIDNFWFCLLHELAHVGRHMENDRGQAFVDDFTLRKLDGRREDPREAQQMNGQKKRSFHAWIGKQAQCGIARPPWP